MSANRTTLTKAQRLLALFAMIALGMPAAASPPTREDQIKAGYLFNFAKFVDWPPSHPDTQLTICFRGGLGIFSALAADLGSKRVGGRPLALRLLPETASPEGCDVLYFSQRDAQIRRPEPETLPGPMLTVGDDKDFTRNGGMIALFTDNNRLKFVINVDNAQRAGIQISSSLLQLASAVEGRQR